MGQPDAPTHLYERLNGLWRRHLAEGEMAKAAVADAA